MRDNFLPGYMNCLDESMSMWTNKFTCPGFMFVPIKHAVDDHNGKRHSPLSLEVVWATKKWPNRVFTFLSITEVNCFLVESHFMSQKSGRILDFQKLLAFDLIENVYVEQEEAACTVGQPESKKELFMVCSPSHPSKTFVG